MRINTLLTKAIHSARGPFKYQKNFFLVNNHDLLYKCFKKVSSPVIILTLQKTTFYVNNTIIKL